METALRILLPKLVPGVDFDIRIFRGKADLLTKLANRRAGYSQWAHKATMGVVVLVDQDDDDCVDLKAELDDKVRSAGLMPASVSSGVIGDTLCRLAIEELEAWFLGDAEALLQAYPRVPASLSKRKVFRDPDAVKGGTWEALERVLQNAGYHTGGLRKMSAARDIAACMNVERNSSTSFQKFREGVRYLVYGDPCATA